MNKINAGNLIIGGVINVVVIGLLESYSPRIALIYTVLLFVAIMIVYKDEIFPALNILIGTVKGRFN